MDNEDFEMRFFVKVKNAKSLHEKATSPDGLNCALIRTGSIMHWIQVAAAVRKAIAAAKSEKQKMATKSIYTEILFNLSPSKNIRESLTTFGIGPEDTEVVAVFLAESGGILTSLVAGEEAPLEEIGKYADLDKIAKIHKIDATMDIGLVQDLLISRAATKGYA